MGEWLTVPVILGALAAALGGCALVLKQRAKVSCYRFEDALIVVLIIGVMVSALLNFNSNSGNYVLAYIFVFGVLYLLMKSLILNIYDIRALLNVNSTAVLFVSLFCVVDLLFWLLFDFDIQAYLPRSTEATATFGLIFRRSYAFATEPTILALYFNTLGVVGLWNVWASWHIGDLQKWAASILLGLAWISTFSAAGFVGLLTGIVTSFVLLNSKRFKLKRKALGHTVKATVIIGLIVVGLVSIFPNVNYFAGIVNKLTLDAYSGQVREEKWEDAIEDIAAKPVFGSGVGKAADEGVGSSLNWYMFLTQEAGLFSSLPIIFFLGLAYFRVYRSNIHGKFWFLTAISAGVVHFLAVSTFFHPYLWTVIAFFYVLNAQRTGALSLPNLQAYAHG